MTKSVGTPAKRRHRTLFIQYADRRNKLTFYFSGDDGCRCLLVGRSGAVGCVMVRLRLMLDLLR